MRIAGSIQHPKFTITVFTWSEKYIVKIETGYFEQTYKFPAQLFSSWEEIKTLLDEAFIQTVHDRFLQMAKDAGEMVKRFETRGGIA